MFESTFIRPDLSPRPTANSQADSSRATHKTQRRLIAHVAAAIDAERARGRLYRTRWRKLRSIAADMFRRSRARIERNPNALLTLDSMVPSIKEMVYWANQRGIARGGQKSQLAVDRKMLIDILSPEFAKLREPAAFTPARQSVAPPLGIGTRTASGIPAY